MNYLSAQDAMRYRRLYAALFCCLPIAFLAGALVLVLPPPPPDWLIFVPFAWFVGFVIAGAVGMWTLWRRAIRVIDPDPVTRDRAMELRWFKPFGALMAFNEVIRSAEKR